MRCRDPLQDAQRAYNRAVFERQRAVTWRDDVALLLAAMVLVVVLVALR